MEILYNGDCLEYIKYLPDNYIDLILQDPPYNKTKCKWDWNILSEIDEFWYEWKRIIKRNGVIAITASQPFSSKLVCSNLDMFKYEWVWVKEKGTGFAFSRKQPLRRTEYVMVFYEHQPTYHYQGDKLEHPRTHVLPIVKSESGGITKDNVNEDGSRINIEYTHKTKDNVILIPRDRSNRGVHPTQKPEALMAYLIETYTNPGDMVFDGFMGSGTTNVAAKKLGRNSIGCEISEEYFNMAVDRIYAV